MARTAVRGIDTEVGGQGDVGGLLTKNKWKSWWRSAEFETYLWVYDWVYRVQMALLWLVMQGPAAFMQEVEKSTDPQATLEHPPSIKDMPHIPSNAHH